MATSVINYDQNEIYSNFIDSLKSQATKKVYAHFLNVFMKFHQVPEGDYAALFVDPERKIKQYFVEASKKDYSKIHFRVLTAALRNFYLMNDCESINWDKVKRFIGETKPPGQDRAYSHEEILTLVQSAPSLKMRAIITLMAASGLRVSAVTNLRLCHLQKIGDLYKISVYEGQKGKGHYTTFCTPEAAQLIDKYLDFRKRCGEPLQPDSILFRKDFDSQFHEEARNHVEPMTAHAIKTNLQRLLVKTGLREVDHVSPYKRHDTKTTHALRKFFVTQLVNADIHETIIKKLSGHKLNNDMTYVYSKQTEETLLESYLKAVNLLTVDPNLKLMKRIEKLEVEKTQFERLAAKIAAIEQKIG